MAVEWKQADHTADLGHDQIQLPVVRLVDLKDGADVRVVECGRRLGFLEEPLLGGLVAGQVRRQQLDGDVPIEAWVMGQVDDAHAAAPELGDDGIRTECRARGEGH